MKIRPLPTESLLERYNCGPVKLSGDHNALYERHVAFDQVVAETETTDRDKFEAIARSVRDVLSQCWLKTEQTYRQRNVKRVYYLSMEFLLGRMLANNVTNLQINPEARQFAKQHQLDPLRIFEQEPDAGLGNGGLGRLAACFLDSMATLGIAGTGYGLRYEYGIFRQLIRDGRQAEQPDHWLARPDPWEVPRPDEAVEVKLNVSFEIRGGALRIVEGRPSTLLGIPYDRPVVGYGGKTINTLRLWAAKASSDFDFAQFSSGDFVGAFAEALAAETTTRVLYPDDHTTEGKGLRFFQEYFLVACSLADLIRRFRAAGNEWSALPEKVAIQLNDTHPAIAVPELMRLLLDDAKLGWDDAWKLTQRTLAYTNHTLLPEALEKWPVQWFQDLLPRHLEIIYEINRRFLGDVRAQYPGDAGRVEHVSLIEEGASRQVRMAHLAIVGSHSTNGVAALHSELLKKQVVPDFAALFPERFNNKTNGVTPRRWLLLANPPLAAVITEAIGDGWITDLAQLEKLKPLADDKSFRAAVRKAKRDTKTRFLQWLDMPGIDPDAVFDTQIKRIHEYKRQLLNALHIVVLYNRLHENPQLELPPRTFFFGGKAAPAYHFAKLVIKFINNLAGTLDGDPITKGRLKVVFVPDYRVSVAEYLIPASDVSEQISTAGYEASGTSNMKFMMNGALTIGTRDGATIEMAEAAGEENLFLFGLTAEQVEASRGWYNPRWHYDNEPETRAALDLIAGNHVSQHEPGIFTPILDALLQHGDHYRHLADLTNYAQAHQRLGELYADQEAWTRKVILNVAASGQFSSDRTIAEYAKEIWSAKPCPI
ncbi:MAG TPA: glycogen/starch/alpha-glucan phosphorylase [Verrucomicrobiae bacterium]|nr:glycogen/starch/alpha-glucan phosphorylase [Verrucomicrobiae bacterium]